MDLSTPALKHPCNVRVLSVLTEFANATAKLLSYMKAQQACQVKYRETQVLNEGNIVMTYHKKLLGPFTHEIEKAIIREMRDKVCVPHSLP